MHTLYRFIGVKFLGDVWIERYGGLKLASHTVFFTKIQFLPNFFPISDGRYDHLRPFSGELKLWFSSPTLPLQDYRSQISPCITVWKIKWLKVPFVKLPKTQKLPIFSFFTSPSQTSPSLPILTLLTHSTSSLEHKEHTHTKVLQTFLIFPLFSLTFSFLLSFSRFFTFFSFLTKTTQHLHHFSLPINWNPSHKHNKKSGWEFSH